MKVEAGLGKTFNSIELALVSLAKLFADVLLFFAKFPIILSHGPMYAWNKPFSVALT